MYVPVIESTLDELVNHPPTNPEKIRHLLLTIWSDGYARGQSDSDKLEDDVEEWWRWNKEDREEIDNYCSDEAFVRQNRDFLKMEWLD